MFKNTNRDDERWTRLKVWKWFVFVGPFSDPGPNESGLFHEGTGEEDLSSRPRRITVVLSGFHRLVLSFSCGISHIRKWPLSYLLTHVIFRIPISRQQRLLVEGIDWSRPQRTWDPRGTRRRVSLPRSPVPRQVRKHDSDTTATLLPAGRAAHLPAQMLTG